MENLFLIYKKQIEGEEFTEIEKVQVLTETEGQLIINNSSIINTINKSRLDTVISDRYLFTYDLATGTRVWNDYFTAEIEELKSKLESATNYLI